MADAGARAAVVDAGAAGRNALSHDADLSVVMVGNRWLGAVVHLLVGSTAGYALSSLSSFDSLIDPGAGPSTYTAVVNGIVVCAIVAGITASAVLPRLSPRATLVTAECSLVAIGLTVVATQPGTLTKWVTALAVGVLLACGCREGAERADGATGAVAIGWMAGAASGVTVDYLFPRDEGFGWTARPPGDEPLTVARIGVTVGLVVATGVALVLHRLIVRDNGIAEGEQRPSNRLRTLAVAVLLPIAACALGRTATTDPGRDWVWFACAAALTILVAAAALVLPRRDGQIVLAGFVAGASALAAVTGAFDHDSWAALVVPVVALAVGAAVSVRRPGIYAPVIAIAAIAAISLVHARGEITGYVLSALTSLLVGWLVVSAAREARGATVAFALPTFAFLSLPYSVYSAGYAPLGADDDDSTWSTTGTSPEQLPMTITALCMIAVAFLTVVVVRRQRGSGRR